MNQTAPHPTAEAQAQDGTNWPVGGLFLDALALRDFSALAACLDPDVRFRALVPPGAFELAGSAATTDRFRRWFGGEDDFEVVDASIGQVGPRLYLRWRVRMLPANDAIPGRLVEQHAFATVGERIEALDLLCSGFQVECH